MVFVFFSTISALRIPEGPRTKLQISIPKGTKYLTISPPIHVFSILSTFFPFGTILYPFDTISQKNFIHNLACHIWSTIGKFRVLPHTFCLTPRAQYFVPIGTFRIIRPQIPINSVESKNVGTKANFCGWRIFYPFIYL